MNLRERKPIPTGCIIQRLAFDHSKSLDGGVIHWGNYSENGHKGSQATDYAPVEGPIQSKKAKGNEPVALEIIP